MYVHWVNMFEVEAFVIEYRIGRDLLELSGTVYYLSIKSLTNAF